MPNASPLLHAVPGRENPVLVGQLRPIEVALPPAEGGRAVLDLLAARWQVPADVVDQMELLLAEVTDLAGRQGHGVVSITVGFAERTLRVAVADEGAAGQGLRWFELGPAPEGAGAQLELRHG